ncbi:hypothetical protein RB195_019241 [Necator americanus]|uniref:Endonuclease/exonuclease/phosphatase domain-containing protein n=1 Tax=Necator americanus TaxID=51031 RepID=A0ABR1CGT7_NECAM
MVRPNQKTPFRSIEEADIQYHVIFRDCIISRRKSGSSSDDEEEAVSTGTKPITVRKSIYSDDEDDGTCDRVGGVGVLVKTSIAENIDSFEQLATRIGRLQMRRCGPTPVLTIFVPYAPTSSYEGDVEAFYMDLEKSYREDHTFYKVIVGDFNANTGPRRTKRKGCIGTHGLQWNEQGENLSEFIMTTKTIHGNSQFQNLLSTQDVGVTRRRDLFVTLAGFWEDSAVDGEYDRLVEHLHDCTKKTESFKTTKERLSLETLELIRQRGAARAAGNQELTSELARLCREAIKEDLKERRAQVLAETAVAGKSIRYARRDFASGKTRMTALRNPKETATALRRGMGKIIYDFYSDLFDKHVYLPPHHLREDGHVIP